IYPPESACAILCISYTIPTAIFRGEWGRACVYQNNCILPAKAFICMDQLRHCVAFYIGDAWNKLVERVRQRCRTRHTVPNSLPACSLLRPRHGSTPSSWSSNRRNAVSKLSVEIAGVV